MMTSCMVELMNDSMNAEMDGVVSFTAYTDCPETKTTLDGNVSKWNGEEWIQVVGRNGNYWFNANTSAPTRSATFTYNGDNGPYNENDVFAVTPAGGSNYGKNFEDMTLSGVTIPSVQTAVAGSYDKNAAVAVAYTDNDKLSFKNVASLLKFTMGSDGIKNVTVWGDMTEVPAGDLPGYVKEGYIYLTVHEYWKSDGARFAAYMWNSSGSTWVDMTEVAGEENMYTCQVEHGYTNILFCRMNPAVTTNRWNTSSDTEETKPVWNQTVDLLLSNGNHFTVTTPWGGQDDKAEGSWSTFSGTTTAGISGTGTVYYNDGTPKLVGASTGYVSLNGDFKKGKTYYIAVAPVVFEKGFTVEFSTVGDYDKFAVKEYKNRVEFKRSTIHDMGVIRSTKETGFFTDPVIPNADEPCTIYYKAAEGDALYGQTGDLYAHTWLRVGGEDSHGPTWGDNSEKYKLSKVSGESNLWSMELTPSIREWFDGGETSCGKIGILARTADTKTQTGNYYLKVNDELYPLPEMPDGLQHGINYIDNSTVTLVLYDRDNQGRSYDFCNLLWDDNWWGYAEKPKKPLNYDDEASCWWITLTDLDPNKQYKFQYQLGRGSDVWVTTFDPYTEILYDRSNDQWIKDYAYGGSVSAEYGDSHYGRDKDFVSAFKINKDIYNWTVSDYRIEDKDDLVIYELLVRDFTDNSYGEGSLRAILEGQWESGKNWLDYLQNLGVNAIELMPVQEFDGNNSWGYSTHAYFAMDKAYGNRTMYKKFIDECHKRGMAVIFDVVYNHATGAHPYAAMYWDGNATASHNPWFHREATHPYNVYHQWNHSNPMVREHVKRNLEYLIKEYKVDGFRFDLSKGFMPGPGDAESYNQTRVDYLKEYAAHIRSVDQNAVMICEHFVDAENYELSKEGIKVWRNMNYNYRKSMKRDMSQANLQGTAQGYNLVSFMESHDEERICYDGQWSYDGSEIPFATRMERAKLNAAFFLLSPGPRMIWQFGEIGYDISIGEGLDRVGMKPYKTVEYLNVKERKSLYDTYSMLLKFRKDNPRFFDSDVSFSWNAGGDRAEQHLYSKSGDGKRFALFGNLGTGTQTVTVDLPSEVQTWYQYDNGAEWKGSRHSPTLSEGQFFLLVSDRSMCR